jgi:phage terminase large subunit-like protein
VSSLTATRQPRTFALWGKQAEFRHSTAPVRGFVGGQGSGKTKVGAYDLIARARAGRLYIVTAPTYKVLRDATCRSFEEVARFFGVLTRPVGGEAFSARLRAFDGDGDAEVLFRSTENPELLRGPNASGCWMDEASLSPYAAYQILTARLREGGELGWLTCTFTPKGRSHWTYAEVFGKPRPGVHLVQAATRDNPFLPEPFLRSVEVAYVGLLADQELGGEFVQVEGAEWPPEYFPDSLFFDDWPPGTWACKVMALDPSKGKDSKPGDYAALIDLRVDGDGDLWCQAELVQGKTAEQIADLAAAGIRVAQPAVFALESNQFQHLFAYPLRDACKRAAVLLPLVELDNYAHKWVRIRSLGPFLRARRLRVKDTPGGRLLVDQMREFPQGQHDDGPDAVEMALRVAAELLASRGEPAGNRVLRG